MAEWIAEAPTSHEADPPAPRPPAPPTITGCPASDGFSSTSTATKKASMSTWTMVASRSAGAPDGGFIGRADSPGVLLADDGDGAEHFAVEAVVVRAGLGPPLLQPGAERLADPAVAALEVGVAVG